MNEKKSGITSIRSWWLAIPGGFFATALTVLLLFFIQGSYFRALYYAFRSSGYLMVLAFAFAIPFSRGQADFSALGVFNICYVALGVFNQNLPFGIATIPVICIGACLGLINSLITLPLCRKKWFFTAGITAILGLAYTYLARLISGESWYNNTTTHSYSHIFLFVFPLLLMLGLAALLSFRSDGIHLFNGIYHKKDFRNRNAIISSAISGVLAAFASLIWGMSTSWAYIQIDYTGMRDIILILALAGVGLPNVKKSKGGAFMGYLSVLLAVLWIPVFHLTFGVLELGTLALYVTRTVLAITFIILNVVLGRKAAKIEDTSEEKAVGDAYRTASEHRLNVNMDDPYAYTGKNKITAMMLAIFLGPFGVPRYYLGYTGQGLAQSFGCASLIIAEIVVNVQLTGRYPSMSAVILAIVLLIYGLITTIWSFVDFIRICTRSLEPVVDEYYYRSIPRTSYLSNNTAPANPLSQVTLEKKPDAAVSALESKTYATKQVKVLVDLAELYKSGAISEEEYNRLKNKILSEM